MRFSGFLRRTKSNASDLTLRKHTPWIASPCASHEGGTSNLLQPYDSHGPRDENDTPVFQHNHESSTVELFYDLFFVANLATFTINHEMVNGEAVKNYLGFFTIIWFTWLETSLFDVRFASDSVFNRVCKAISFAVMVGFAVSGSLYNTQDVVDNVKAFRAMALILMVSRLTLFLQYGVVLFYVRKYQKVYAPLLATMAVLFITAMIFLGTAFGFPTDEVTESGEPKQPRTYIAWYVVICVEATVVIVISSIWRVVSFKHTHLVERVGLLTLIIMGEGIFGMTKAVSKILQTSNVTHSRDIGVIAATVLLIYFIWVLYFDQIEHDRFGTIRQQIWAMLHFPLHVAILLTVEGAANLVIWNITAPFLVNWVGRSPLLVYDDGSASLIESINGSSTAVADYCQKSIKSFLTVYREQKKLSKYYDYETTISKIRNVTRDEFSTYDGYWSVLYDVDELWSGVTNGIFETFGVELPETGAKETTSAAEEFNKYFEIFDTVFTYYYIAAGFFLITLAVLYWFGKNNKTWQEWTSMGIRTFFGVNLTLIMAWSYIAPLESKARAEFVLGPWHIPMVMLTFFVVIVLDNLLVWHTNKTIAKQAIGQYNNDHEENQSMPQKNGYMAASTDYDVTPSDSMNGYQDYNTVR